MPWNLGNENTLGLTEQPRNTFTSEICVVRSGKGRRPEDYVAPPQEELELQAELASADRTGPTASLNEALDQVLGIAPQEERSGGRRERGKARGKGKRHLFRNR